MEEGVPPLPPGPNRSPNSARNPDVNVIDPLTAVVPFNKATYVVQVPKEQIFRIPPAENARIVEEYRNRMKTHSKTPQYCSRIAFMLGILLVIVLTCLLSILVFYLVAKPTSPHFDVARVSEFGITMRAQNPSATMDFHYENGGSVGLIHQGKRIATGDPPTFNIGHKDTTEIKISLQGSKGGLFRKIANGSKGSKDVVPLTLSGDFPVNLGFGALQMRKKDLSVNCNLRVRKMAKEIHVVSQSCKANL